MSQLLALKVTFTFHGLSSLSSTLTQYIFIRLSHDHDLLTYSATASATCSRADSLKGKGSPYSITERRVPELIRFLAVSLQVT